MRPIDADALMREFAEFVRRSNNSDFANTPTWNDAVSLLGSAPTIEPKRGKWEQHIGIGNVALIKCSECGFIYPELLGVPIFNFCPHCGAKMERGEE